jgi:hypothetical protein
VRSKSSTSSCSCQFFLLLFDQNCNTSKRLSKAPQYRTSWKSTQKNWSFYVQANGRTGMVKPTGSLLGRFVPNAPKAYQNNRCTNRDTTQRRVKRVTAKLAFSLLIRRFKILLDRSLPRVSVPRYCSRLCYHNAITKACQTTCSPFSRPVPTHSPERPPSVFPRYNLESKCSGWVG